MALIDVSNLTFGYEGSSDLIFENVSFQMDTDWRLGFTGRNGRGKTTFLRLLMGKQEYQGRISSPVEYDYFPFETGDESRTARLVVDSLVPDRQPWQLERELSLLEVPPEALERPLGTLSRGERTKLLLAALFLRENRFLLIDEPTNHLDMAGREILARYLRGKKGFILVSHDRALLDGCADHILSINKLNIQVCKGNFSSWLENKAREDQFQLGENQKLQGEIRRLSEAARRTAGWSDKVERGKIGQGAYDRGYIGHKAAKLMQRSKAAEARRQKAVEKNPAC